MYQQHFGLREAPFNLTPDTGYFYNYPSHREALNTLMVAIAMGEGFIKVTGEVGTGKTLLCRKLLSQLDDDIVTAYIPNPMLSPKELRQALADELGIHYERNVDPHRLLKMIYAELVKLRARGKKTVLLIDEAQAMPKLTLESLRLLTNLETEKFKLLQVVLVGQPELDKLLNMDCIRQLKQRITFAYELSLIDRKNIADYIDHRLSVAGYNGAKLFSNRALRVLGNASQGTPRVINILCHKALMAAYGQGVRQIEKQHVSSAVKDSDCTPPTHFDSRLATNVGLSTCMLAGLGLIFAGVSL